MAQETWTAKQVAAEASRMVGRPIRATIKSAGSYVRGLARGDYGAPVIKRLMDDAYTSHVYSARERTALLTAIAAREGRRTGKVPHVPVVRGEGAASRAAESALDGVSATPRVKSTTTKRTDGKGGTVRVSRPQTTSPVSVPASTSTVTE